MQRKRIEAVTARRSRYRRLGKVAAKRLLRSGAAPALRFGAGVCGVPDSSIRMVRRFSCNLQGEMRGRSTFARLQLAAYDAGADLAVAPIYEWARAVWDGLVDKGDLQVTWQQALVTAGLSAQPFLQVSGPAGAMVASARRLGWAVPSPKDFRTCDGTLLQLDSVCPAIVKLHAVDDLRRKEAAESSLANRIGGPPDLEPLTDFLASKRARRNPALAGSLRAPGEGGWWTQQRLRAWKAYQIPIAEQVGPTRRAASKLPLGCPERWAAYITERALVLPPSRCEIPTSTKRLSAGPKVHCTAASLSTNTGCHCCISDQPHQGQRSFGVAATRHLAISPSLAMDSRMVP